MRLQLALRVGLGELDPAVCGQPRRALHRALLKAVHHVVHGARRRVAAAPLARDRARDDALVVVLDLLAARERLRGAGDALPVRGRRRAGERDDGGQQRVPDLGDIGDM